MSIYTWIALGVIVGFVAGWCVAMHLPYYYHPQIKKRFRRFRRLVGLSPKLKTRDCGCDEGRNL